MEEGNLLFIDNFMFDCYPRSSNGNCVQACETGGDGEEDSKTSVSKTNRNRVKTLASERKRRGRMKERLYELRSLVPTITKMDKASIIADSIDYVRSLQSIAKELGEEISVLESSMTNEEMVAGDAIETEEYCYDKPCGGRILSVEAHEVGEGRFYVKVECDVGDGVATLLYNAIESLHLFTAGNSSLTINGDRFVLTLNLQVRGMGEVMNVSNVKLWVMGALLKEGFGFDISVIC